MPNQLIKAEALKTARSKKGWSQDELAEKIKVHKRTVAQWEKVNPDGSLNPIRSKAFSDLCKVLTVNEEQLTGEKPLDSDDYDTGKHKISATISGNAKFAYDVIDRRYGVKMPELIESAPMLFEALSHVFLNMRLDNLKKIEAAFSEIKAILPGIPNEILNIFAESYHTSQDALEDILLHEGSAGETKKDYRDSEFIIDCEKMAIDEHSALTPSHWDNYSPHFRSNRFLDMLHELGIHPDRITIANTIEDGKKLPSYFMGTQELRDLLGIHNGDDVENLQQNQELLWASLLISEGLMEISRYEQKPLGFDQEFSELLNSQDVKSLTENYCVSWIPFPDDHDLHLDYEYGPFEAEIFRASPHISLPIGCRPADMYKMRPRAVDRSKLRFADLEEESE